ncbi:MAG: RNase adapter RapZ, partial [Desulfohalobium sp.]
FLEYLLPLYAQEGRYRLTLALGCTGGRHRSVAVTEALAEALQRNQYDVSLEHRHWELG